MRVGAHVSIAGGINEAPERAYELGGNCLQIFSKNPRGWKARELSAGEAEQTVLKLQELNLDPLVVHITYLVNLASPDDELYRKSLDGLITDLKRSGLIGAKYLVLHPGKYGNSSKEDGIKRIAESINDAFLNISNDVMILLENVAGAGTEIGQTFEELKQIMDLIDDSNRVGICFDTCHGFAAGYDLRTPESISLVFKYFDEIIGLERLKVIHANDAKGELGSNLDRHEHIGMGKIGEKGFKALVNHSFIVANDIPFIVETPIDDLGNHKTNIDKLKSFRE